MTSYAEYIAILWTCCIVAFTIGYIMGASVNISKEYDRTISQAESTK